MLRPTNHESITFQNFHLSFSKNSTIEPRSKSSQKINSLAVTEFNEKKQFSVIERLKNFFLDRKIIQLTVDEGKKTFFYVKTDNLAKFIGIKPKQLTHEIQNKKLDTPEKLTNFMFEKHLLNRLNQELNPSNHLSIRKKIESNVQKILDQAANKLEKASYDRAGNYNYANLYKKILEKPFLATQVKSHQSQKEVVNHPHHLLYNRFVSTSQKVNVLSAIANDVAQLHKKGWVYGHLSPNQLLIQGKVKQPGTFKGVLRDAGALTKIGQNLQGVDAYSSPRLIKAERRGETLIATVKDDSFSLGLTLFQVIAKHHVKASEFNQLIVRTRVNTKGKSVNGFIDSIKKREGMIDDPAALEVLELCKKLLKPDENQRISCADAAKILQEITTRYAT